MKRLFLFFFLATSVAAQGSRHDGFVITTAGRPVAGASIRVCVSSSSGTPCTPLATIYSDRIGTPLTNPTTTDANGNYFFFAVPGRYDVQISGIGINTVTMRDVAVPIDPTGGVTTATLVVTTTATIDTLTVGKANNILFVDGVKFVTVADAYAALPSTGGMIVLPLGVAPFSSTLIITKPLHLVGQGQSLGGTTQGSVLSWTGGASAAIIIKDSTANRVLLEGFSLVNNGTATIGIDIDNTGGGYPVYPMLRNVSITAGTAQFSDSKIRIGHTATVSSLWLDHFFAAEASPATGGACIRAENVFHLSMLASTCAYHKGGELVLGTATQKVYSIRVVNSNIESAANQDAIIVNNVESASFDNDYFESDGTGHLLNIPNTAVFAKNIVLANSRFKGDAWGNPTPYAINVNLATATLTVKDSYFTSAYNYAVHNQAVGMLNLSGITMEAGSGLADIYTNANYSDSKVSATLAGLRITGQVISAETVLPPLVVSSNVKVTSLNADLLDDKDSATAGTATTIAARDASGRLTSKRFIADGTALVAGDFGTTPTANWGTGAAYSGIIGTDQGFQLTITAGTTPGASPTIPYTYKNGTWGSSPIFVCKQVGGTGAIADVTGEGAASATALTLTWVATPVNALTYVFSCVGIGR